MKELLVPVFLVLAVLAGVFWWGMRGDSIASNRSTSEVPLAPAETKPAPVSPKPAIHQQPKAVFVKPVPTAAAEVEPMPSAATVSEPTPAPALPFPTVEQIASGAQEDKILQRYGDPVLSTTTSDHDHVFETLIYARDQGQLQTVIRVEDGKVTLAYAQSMPPPMSAVPPNTRVRH